MWPLCSKNTVHFLEILSDLHNDTTELSHVTIPYVLGFVFVPSEMRSEQASVLRRAIIQVNEGKYLLLVNQKKSSLAWYNHSLSVSPGTGYYG